jgi:hypothetical protein
VKYRWGALPRDMAKLGQSRKKRPNRDKRWRHIYRARMDAGMELCRLCRRNPATRFGHLLAESLGGTAKMSNTTLTCASCEILHDNRTHSIPSLTMEEHRAQPEARWSQVGTGIEWLQE